MKENNVYGIGNALVDIEFEVTNDFLDKMNVEKGLMTLVDETRQSELLGEFAGVQHKRSCGGSAANSMIAISQFGGKSFYSCKVAKDEAGDFYYKDLVDNGVKTNLGDGRKEGVTGKCMVFITPDADRTMNTYLGITETFSKEELREEEIKKSEYLYIEGYLVTSETGKAAAITAKKVAEENGIKTSLTLSDPGVVDFFKDGFTEIIGDGVDLIFCNESEAMKYTGMKTPLDAAEELKKIAKTFAITMGPKGAYVYDGEHDIEVVSPSVEAIDTNGAGDCFAGAFLYCITNGYDFRDAGRVACHAASELVTQFGARLSVQQAQKIIKVALA